MGNDRVPQQTRPETESPQPSVAPSSRSSSTPAPRTPAPPSPLTTAPSGAGGRVASNGRTARIRRSDDDTDTKSDTGTKDNAGTKDDTDTKTVTKQRVKRRQRTPADDIAAMVRDVAKEGEIDYAYRGMGGGGLSVFKDLRNIRRSDEVKAFRKHVKYWARKQAYEDLDAYITKKTTGKSATKDYQRMVAGNKAYSGVKPIIDEQLRAEATSMIDDGLLDQIEDAARTAAHQILHSPYYGLDESEGALREAAREAAWRAAQPLLTRMRQQTRTKKDLVVGKRGTTPQGRNHFTTAGEAVSDRVDDAVHDSDLAKRSLDKAITAPTMSIGLRALGTLIDGVLTGPGEQVELSITFNIPTGTGLSVVFKMQGMASKGTDGASTAGVTVPGDPNRVEVSAKLSGGVGADAIGLKSSATVGLFLRAGSDEGTAACLQALSYGAYTGLPRHPSFLKDLWAPDDKSGVAESARQRAEMWAAMVEEQQFQGKGSSTFADVGFALDGGFGANTGAAKFDASIGEVIFSHYDEDTLKESLTFVDDPAKKKTGKAKSHFAERVRSDQEAKRRRQKISGEKRLALSAGFSMSVDVPGTPHSVEFSVGMSGSSIFSNWGVEIVAGCGMASTENAASVAEKILNSYSTGLAELIKKIMSMFRSDDDAGGMAPAIAGSLLQMPADVASIVDGIATGSVSDGIGEAEHMVDKAAFDTAIGDTPEVDEAGKTIEQTAESVWEASSMLQFVLTFGVNAADPSNPTADDVVIRFELRSKRGLDVGAGSPVELSASKLTRLFSAGKNGSAGFQVEFMGLRGG